MAAPTVALITGASAGLGREYARALAARGHDLVLVARRADRLAALADELRDRYRVEVEVCVADLTTDDGCARCRAAVVDRAIDVAVLNAGFGSLGPFAEADASWEAAMVRLNCVSVIELTRAVLPGMIGRGRGAVLIVSSAAAWHPVPYMATYGATKAFELHFVQALAEEVRGTGVRVGAVCPGPTATEFSDVLDAAGRTSGSGWPQWMPIDTAADVVATSLGGLDRGRVVIATGRIAWFTRLWSRVIPRSVGVRAAGVVHRRRSRGRGAAGIRHGD